MKTKLKKWKKISSRIIFRNKYYSLYHDVVRLPTGKPYDYYVRNKKSRAVIVLPIDTQGRILLTKEYRYPIDKILYGAVAGGICPNETPRAAARRELREETGYRARRFTSISSFYGNPAKSGTVFHIYTALGLVKGMPNQEEAEFIEWEFVSQRAFRLLVLHSLVRDPYLITAYYLYTLTKKYTF